jgi:hypothetical protein
MARRIGDDKFAARCREIAVGHVDGDLLLALGLQAIHEQSEIKRPRPARPLGVAFGASELILINLCRVVEQTPDQSALAVIDTAAGEETQQASILLGDEAGLESLLGVISRFVDETQAWHQKYPSCFFFSIEPCWS